MNTYILVKMYNNGQRYNEQVFSSKKKAADRMQTICDMYEKDGFDVQPFHDSYFDWTGFKCSNGRDENTMTYFVESFKVE